MSAPLLRFERVRAGFGSLEVLRDVDLEVHAGEFVALVGPSGCGKTTILNLASGWLAPSGGRVERAARVRMVFQQDGLFPWRTVAENVRLGLRHVADEAARARRVSEFLALVALAPFAGHYPHQLSGGMRQRAELARLLTEQPRTVVLVTHDIEEAAQLADRVLVLSERPARIRDEVRLQAPRPRAATHPDVVRAVHHILTLLGLESDRETPALAPVEVP